MAIYYYEDQNGKYSSHTDARRFSRVSGKEAYTYLKSAEGKAKRFMKANDYEDGGEDVFVEIPAEFIRDYRQGERREQYVNDIREDAGFTEISLYAMQGDGNPNDLLSGEELIADESVDVVAEVMHKMELETLRKALLSLSEDEHQLIYDLFLKDNPLTERDLSKKYKVSQPIIHKKKCRFLRNSESFFEKGAIKREKSVEYRVRGYFYASKAYKRPSVHSAE